MLNRSHEQERAHLSSLRDAASLQLLSHGRTPRLLQIEGAHLLRDDGGGAVTVSMRVMTAGDGFRYLLRTVVAGDGERSMSTPLTRYYSAKGTPPGRWLGSGLPGIGAGSIADGTEVTESQLQLLIGRG